MIKIKLEIFDVLDIWQNLMNVRVNKIDDLAGFLIFDFVKGNKINLIEKIEKAKESYSNEINLKFDRATGAALYFWLINFKCSNQAQSNKYAFIAGIIHQAIINSLTDDFIDLPALEQHNTPELNKPLLMIEQ